MTLSKNAIETLSVNAVRNSIVTSKFLDQFISDNDKEPSWDGFVYVYGHKSKKKSYLKGRMPIQIKGKQYEDHSKSTISFSMLTVDLRNYLYDGGCVLFVVYIGNYGLTNKIYYTELTPIKLRHLLYKAKNQTSKTIHLKEFPKSDNEKATIFLNCLHNCRRQSSFIEGKLLSLEELEEQGMLEKIVIPFSWVGCTDTRMAFIKNEVYLYAKIKGSSIEQPIEVIPKNIHTKQTINALITINNKLFYNNYCVIKNAKEIIIQLGDSFKMKIIENESLLVIDYENSDKIRILATDLDFLLTYIDKGHFKINDINFPLDYKGINFSSFEIEKERARLYFAKKVVRVLDVLGCSDDIDINDLDDEGLRNINRLITAFLDKKPVKGLKEDLPIAALLKVGKLKFAIHLKQCEEKGSYEIYDFFKVDLIAVLMDENNDDIKFPISQFSILLEDDFLTLSNIDFDVLLPSFQKVEHHNETFNNANDFLLELLKAYDKAEGERKEKLLKVCVDFSNWISEAPDEKLDYQIKTLNVLQTIKRYREFNLEEIKKLYSIIENNTREDCVVGAYLLLDQQQAAEIHFAKLSEEEQNNFKKYPIYHFWRN